MANDKITMLKLKRMLQLLDAGRSMNQVCAELHMSKRTVHSYKERAEQSEIPLYVLRQMPDEQLNALLQPPSSVPVPDARKAELDRRLDHFRSYTVPYCALRRYPIARHGRYPFNATRKILHVSTQTFHRYRKMRLIPFIQRGRKIYVKRSDLDAFQEANRIEDRYNR